MVLLRQGMQQFRNYYNSEVQMRNRSFPWVCISQIYNYISSRPRSKAENKEVVAKKHSEAERKNVEPESTINIYTLRRIPNIINQHQNSSSVSCIGNEPNRVKASILAETIKQLRKLKKSVPKTIIPSWEDDLTSEQCNQEQQDLVKVTLSCDDRPGLILAIEKAVASVKARVVKAEVVTGRAKFVLWVQGLVSPKKKA